MTETHSQVAPCPHCGRPMGRSIIRHDDQMLSATFRITKHMLLLHRDWPTLRGQIVEQMIGELDEAYAQLRMEKSWTDTLPSTPEEESNTSSPA